MANGSSPNIDTTVASNPVEVPPVAAIDRTLVSQHNIRLPDATGTLHGVEAWTNGQIPTRHPQLAQTIAQQLSESGKFRIGRPQDQPDVGELPDEYHLEQHLGDGTYGMVWLARTYERDESGTTVMTGEYAIKFYKSGFREEALQELRRLASLRFLQGVVQVDDWDARNLPPYIVMQLAKNGSLQGRIDDLGKVPYAQALPLFMGIVRGMANVHTENLLHCDLKPANVLLNHHDDPMIGDFGQAQIAGSISPVAGTYFYMPPEQATFLRTRGQPTSSLPEAFPHKRWDVYALGAMFYTMITGERPRDDGSLVTRLGQVQTFNDRLDVYMHQMETCPMPPLHGRRLGVPKELSKLIQDCLSLDPTQRPADANSLLKKLNRFQLHQRRRPLIGLGILGSLLLFSLLGAFGYIGQRYALRQAYDDMAEMHNSGTLASARLASRGLQELFQNRVSWLENIAANNEDIRLNVIEMGNVLREAQAKGQLDAKVDGMRPTDLVPLRTRDILNGHLEALTKSIGNRDYFEGLVVTAVVGGHGYHLARLDKKGEPSEDTEYLDIDWAFRDWYTGQGNILQNELPKEGRQPIRRSHISQPYKGRSERRDKAQDRLLITVSVPIRKKPNGPVLGLLNSSIDLKQFSAWVSQSFETTDGTAPIVQPVIMQKRGYLVYYEDMLLRPKGYNQQADVCEYGWVHDRLRSELSHEEMLEGHFLGEWDPLNDLTRELVSYSRFDPYPTDQHDQSSGREWFVLMLSNAQAVQQPVSDLRWSMAMLASGLVVAFVVLLLGLWCGLIRVMRREESIHG